ncbi:DUF1801 domain-containing protein [Candidatus Saccharibacteria bacterium]|nr:DUF1801 domain-containing protein [Candidatus Saccharibacteria bacterium]
MSPVETYLANTQPAERAALERICKLARQLIPEPEEARSYGMPAFKYRGKPVVGFLVWTTFMSLYPFSSDAVTRAGSLLDGFEFSKGTVRFTLEKTIPEDALKLIINARLAEITAAS